MVCVRRKFVRRAQSGSARDDAVGGGGDVVDGRK